MKRKRILALAVTISLTLVMLTGCTTYQNFRTAFFDDNVGEDVTITIGVFEPITGGDSKAAESEIRGIQLANETHPNINGKIVDLVYSDNASDIYAAETAIKNLISYNPDVILGSYGSVYSMVAGKTINEAKIPAMAITNLNPLVTKNCEYYYRVCYVDSTQGDILAKYILEATDEKNAGIIVAKDNDLALARASSFTNRMEGDTNNPDAISAYEYYKTGDTDFTNQLMNIKQSGVKFCLLPGEKNEVAEIIKDANKMNLDVTFLGSNEWATDEFKELLGSDLKRSNIAFVTYIDPTMNADNEKLNKVSEKFIEAYQKKYGEDTIPDENVALGYDAYIIAINAVAAAGDHPTGEKIKAKLDGQQTFEGVSGTVNFNDVGDPIKTAYISTFKNGKPELLYTIKPSL